MTQIKKVKTSEGVQFYPQTHTKAVIDDNGYTAESRLGAMQDEINQAQLAVGAVPSDLTPTEDSTNWVTSGGIYNAIQEVSAGLAELTGEELSNEKVIAAALVELASKVDDGYTFKGLVTPTDGVGTQIQKVAYLGFPGEYNNVGNNEFVIPEDHIGLFTYDNGVWNLRTVKYQPDAYTIITDFSDWTIGYIDKDGRIFNTDLKYKYIKVLAGQTITVESYQLQTAIRHKDGTPISSGAVNTPKNIFTYTPEETEYLYVCVYVGTSFGDKTPPVVTLSNIGTKWLSKENIVSFDNTDKDVADENLDYSVVSAKSLKKRNIVTEKDGLWLRGYVTRDKVFSNTANGSVYKFKNDNYSYLCTHIPSLKTGIEDSCYAVSFYNEETTNKNTFIGGVTYKNVRNHEVKMSIPNGCKYIYISAGIQAGIAYRNTTVRLFRNTSYLSLKDLLDNFKIQKDTTIFDGVDDLPSIYDKYGQYVDIRNNFAYPGTTTSTKTNFRFMFCSDVHKNEDAFKRIVNLTNRWAKDGCVDALINTGDVAYDRPNENFDWYNTLRLQSNVDVLTTVGNHDWDYYIGGDKERTYNNIISPMVEGTVVNEGEDNETIVGKVENIIQPSDGAEAYRFYYYKDYDTVRFIALYVRVDTADQLTWLEEVLEDARTNGKHVIIANHEPYDVNLAHLKFSTPEEFYNKVPNTFFSSFGSIQNSSYVESGGAVPATYCAAVKNFMDAGGVFVCWLSGHIHIDHFYELEDTETYGHQLMLNTAAVRQDEQTGEFVRKGSIGNRDLYNFVSVSTDQMMLKVLRIGANTDYIGRSKIVFTYHYGIHKVIANY